MRSPGRWLRDSDDWTDTPPPVVLRNLPHYQAVGRALVLAALEAQLSRSSGVVTRSVTPRRSGGAHGLPRSSS
jgi:hypothetical protein